MSIWDSNTIRFARKSEKKCDEYFSIVTGITGWFQSVTKMEENNRTDYSGITKDNRTITIELKNRDISINQYDTIMIEPDKFCSLTAATTNCSWYINFLESSYNKFWIVDAKSVTENQIQIKRNVKITNPELGENYSYNEDRFYIPTSCGRYYEYNTTNNRFQRIF